MKVVDNNNPNSHFEVVGSWMEPLTNVRYVILRSDNTRRATMISEEALWRGHRIVE